MSDHIRHPCLKDSCLNELTVHGLVDGVLVLSRLRSLVVHLSGLVGQPKLLLNLTKEFQIYSNRMNSDEKTICLN